MIYDRGQRMVIMNSNKLIDKCMSIIGKWFSNLGFT